MVKEKSIKLEYEYSFEDWVAGLIKAEELEILVETGKLSNIEYYCILQLQQEKLEPKESRVIDYNYNYEDWLSEVIKPNQLATLLEEEKISEELYYRITKEQDKAFLKRMADSLEALKTVFFKLYDNDLLKHDFLKEEIRRTKGDMLKIKEDHNEVYERVLFGNDGRRKLNAKRIEYYSTFVVGKDWEWDWEYGLLRHYYTDITPFNYILKANYLSWLKWFKIQEKINNAEPSINISTAVADREIIALTGKKDLSYSWLSNPNEELTELFQRLIDKALLHSDTTLDQFKIIFTAKPLNLIKPLNWIGAKNLLVYFLDSIYHSRKISLSVDIWSIGERCFLDAKGLAQLKNRYLDNKSEKHSGKPKNYQIVDEALKGL